MRIVTTEKWKALSMLKWAIFYPGWKFFLNPARGKVPITISVVKCVIIIEPECSQCNVVPALSGIKQTMGKPVMRKYFCSERIIKQKMCSVVGNMFILKWNKVSINYTHRDFFLSDTNVHAHVPDNYNVPWMRPQEPHSICALVSSHQYCPEESLFLRNEKRWKFKKKVTISEKSLSKCEWSLIILT